MIYQGRIILRKGRWRKDGNIPGLRSKCKGIEAWTATGKSKQHCAVECRASLRCFFSSKLTWPWSTSRGTFKSIYWLTEGATIPTFISIYNTFAYNRKRNSKLFLESFLQGYGVTFAAPGAKKVTTFWIGQSYCKGNILVSLWVLKSIQTKPNQLKETWSAIQ